MNNPAIKSVHVSTIEAVEIVVEEKNPHEPIESAKIVKEYADAGWKVDANIGTPQSFGYRRRLRFLKIHPPSFTML